eukprot:3169061-Amphidinium_carterae.1
MEERNASGYQIRLLPELASGRAWCASRHDFPDATSSLPSVFHGRKAGPRQCLTFTTHKV